MAKMAGARLQATSRSTNGAKVGGHGLVTCGMGECDSWRVPGRWWWWQDQDQTGL